MSLVVGSSAETQISSGDEGKHPDWCKTCRTAQCGPFHVSDVRGCNPCAGNGRHDFVLLGPGSRFTLIEKGKTVDGPGLAVTPCGITACATGSSAFHPPRRVL